MSPNRPAATPSEELALRAAVIDVLTQAINAVLPALNYYARGKDPETAIAARDKLLIALKSRSRP